MQISADIVIGFQKLILKLFFLAQVVQEIYEENKTLKNRGDVFFLLSTVITVHNGKRRAFKSQVTPVLCSAFGFGFMLLTRSVSIL